MYTGKSVQLGCWTRRVRWQFNDYEQRTVSAHNSTPNARLLQSIPQSTPYPSNANHIKSARGPISHGRLSTPQRVCLSANFNMSRTGRAKESEAAMQFSGVKGRNRWQYLDHAGLRSGRKNPLGPHWCPAETWRPGAEAKTRVRSVSNGSDHTGGVTKFTRPAINRDARPETALPLVHMSPDA